MMMTMMMEHDDHGCVLMILMMDGVNDDDGCTMIDDEVCDLRQLPLSQRGCGCLL